MILGINKGYLNFFRVAIAIVVICMFGFIWVIIDMYQMGLRYSILVMLLFPVIMVITIILLMQTVKKIKAIIKENEITLIYPLYTYTIQNSNIENITIGLLMRYIKIKKAEEMNIGFGIKVKTNIIGIAIFDDQLINIIESIITK